MTGRSTALQERDAVIKTLAAEGHSAKAIAQGLGVDVQLVYKTARDGGFKIVRGLHPKTAASGSRNMRMVSMFKQGLTLTKIAAQFGVTRERVRQIMKRHGVAPKEGGLSLKVAGQRREADAQREANALAKWGFPCAVVSQLRADGLIRAFAQQRKNARNRGIDFRLSFAQWFAVWQSSGKLEQRGRGKGKYAMSRVSDAGCYEMGNVHIQLSEENSREAVKQWLGKKKIVSCGVFMLYPGTAKPWFTKVGKQSLGTHATEAEALAVREAYIAAHPEAKAKNTGRGYARIQAAAGRSERFQVMVGRKYVGSFRSADEALAARAAFLAATPKPEAEAKT